ncbi:HAMP domain-containing sensor histidine kinase [Bosea sp. 685]|uniref:sensor histidine kinase n=1 Tax=Bosea sp. 685 TaxID=3080057 RepID=UPI002892F700|nr:HAMP domain-containing sensor histidine kinase [Bosea sp. 685]WNJ88662.1 HAMP domain-containing sensor histidine kinase [Bosea sp. 685]
MSLRALLIGLWILIVLSAAATGFLFVSFYRETASVQAGRAQDRLVSACRDIADRYAFFASGWGGPGAGRTDEELRRQLTNLVQLALARSPQIEGGIWRESEGALAYAFPTYEGTGPKTDLPAAELATIGEVNAAAAAAGKPTTVERRGQSQILLLHACPLGGPTDATLTGWTMTRIAASVGPAYDRLMTGFAVLALTVLGSALWLGWLLVAWSRRIARLEADLAAGHDADLPRLAPTGLPELDRLVQALNASGERLSDARRRATSAERLAAVGRLVAGVAHEVRNPVAAMRLKAENALAAGDEQRRSAALGFILDQIARLDRLLRDLLTMSQPREPRAETVDLARFLAGIVAAFGDRAAAVEVKLIDWLDPDAATAPPPRFDAGEIGRIVENLIGNALRHTPAGGSVELTAARRGENLVIAVRDDGPGVPAEIRDRLFEPFVTGHPEGTGLGLAIAREIAGVNRATVRLLPSDRGAHFEIELPWHHRPS